MFSVKKQYYHSLSVIFVCKSPKSLYFHTVRQIRCNSLTWDFLVCCQSFHKPESLPSQTFQSKLEQSVQLQKKGLRKPQVSIWFMPHLINTDILWNMPTYFPRFLFCKEFFYATIQKLLSMFFITVLFKCYEKVVFSLNKNRNKSDKNHKCIIQMCWKTFISIIDIDLYAPLCKVDKSVCLILVEHTVNLKNLRFQSTLTPKFNEQISSVWSELKSWKLVF